jgi:hypothetical protein
MDRHKQRSSMPRSPQRTRLPWEDTDSAHLVAGQTSGDAALSFEEMMRRGRASVSPAARRSTSSKRGGSAAAFRSQSPRLTSALQATPYSKAERVTPETGREVGLDFSSFRQAGADQLSHRRSSSAGRSGSTSPRFRALKADDRSLGLARHPVDMGANFAQSRQAHSPMASASSRELPWNAHPGMGGMQRHHTGETGDGAVVQTLEYQDMLNKARAEHRAAKQGISPAKMGSWARSTTPKLSGPRGPNTPGPGAFDPLNPTVSTSPQRSPRRSDGRSYGRSDSPRFKQQAVDIRPLYGRV